MKPHKREAYLNAMVLWEAALEDSDDLPMFTAYREQHGVCETRDRILDLVEPLGKAWRIACRLGFDAPFDWEFAPAFLRLGTTCAWSAIDLPEIKLTMKPSQIARAVLSQQGD